MWPLPRELLWAVIMALAVAVVSLWPSGFPYAVAPQLGVVSEKSSVSPPAYLKDELGSHSSEVWGIKPGEWLLGLGTIMLWLATAKLVRGAEKTSEVQLRPYVHIKAADFEWGGKLRIVAHCTNTGQTPATFYEIGCVSFVSDAKASERVIPKILPYNAWASLGAGGTDSCSIYEGLSEEHARTALSSGGTKPFMILGRVRYGDVFGNEYETEFVYFTRDVRPNGSRKMSRAVGQYKTYFKTKSNLVE